MGGFISPGVVGATQLNPAPDPLQTYGRVVQLRTAMQEQQQRGLQMQQMMQQLRDQQALTQAFKGWDPTKQSYDDLAKSVVNLGGSGTAALGIQQHALQIRSTASQIAKNDSETGSKNLDTVINRHDQILGALDAAKQVPDQQLGQHVMETAQRLQQEGILTDPTIAQNVQRITQLPPDQMRSQLDMFEKSLIGQKQQFANAKTQAETEASQTAAAKNKAELEFYQKMGLAPGVTPEMAGYAAFLQKGGKPEAWAAFKAQTEAAATQPYKIQTAEAEGRARQLIEGLEKPVYVFGQGSQRQLMSATDAIKAGYRTMLPVTEKQVGEDIQLNNRLADVENKVGRYQQSFAADLSLADKNAIAQLIGEDRFKAGLWGTTLPVDFLNKANEAYLHGKLSKQAQDRLISYFNANESLIGYNRVLSGSARSNEKQLELQSRTLPSPMDAPAYGNNALSQFKENLDFAGQGLPQLPGIKTHQQVRADLQAETAQRGQQRNVAGGLQVGQSVKLKNGKTVRVTAVHPDGSFDAR